MGMWDQLDQFETHPDYEHVITDDLVLLLPPSFRSDLPESPMMRRAIAVALLSPLLSTALGADNAQTRASDDAPARPLKITATLF